MATRRHGSGNRRPTEWLGVFLDDSMSTTASTNRIFTELTMQEKGPFTVLRIIANWTAQGVLTADAAMMFAVGLRKVVLDRQSDTVAQVGGTILEADYFGSDEIMFMTQEHLSPAFRQVDPSTGATEIGSRPMASGIWDIKAKRKLSSANETLVFDTEQTGVGASEEIRLRVAFRILIQPH